MKRERKVDATRTAQILRRQALGRVQLSRGLQQGGPKGSGRETGFDLRAGGKRATSNHKVLDRNGFILAISSALMQGDGSG